MRHGLLVLLLLATPLRADEPDGKLIVKPDAFKTLVNPNCSHCKDEAKRRGSELRADDRVLCWTRGYSDGGAIPIRFFLNPYRVISDSYGVFVYDPDAGYARGFSPSYQFTFHGWRNGVMVMKHKDGTLYSCLSGVAFDGPKKGSRLQPVPTLVSDWGYVMKNYPNAVAYHLFDKYQPTDMPITTHEDSRRSRGSPAPLLPANTPVLGVWDGKQASAFVLKRYETAGSALNTVTVAGRTFYVLWYAPTKTASAYANEASPPRKFSAPQPNSEGVSPPEPATDARKRTVTLNLDVREGSPAPFVDDETKSRWDVYGRAVEGPLKGWTLTWLDSTQVKWFAWSAEYPKTTIHGNPKN